MRLLRVAERLEYGIVSANAGIISAANVPFGGVKESGYGRDGGAEGIDEFMDVKYVLVRRRELALSPSSSAATNRRPLAARGR